MPKDSPKPQQSVPAAAEDASGSPFDDGVLDASEKTRIRDLVSSAVSFLASRRLLPAVLMRVGPMRVLLPIIWGIGFLRSRRWASGIAFLGVGLLSLVMALGPEIHFETAEAEDSPKQTESADNTQHDAEATDDSPSVSSFMRPKQPVKSTATSPSRRTRGSSFREPIFAGSNAASTSGRTVRPASAVATKHSERGGVWLIGTIEEVEDGGFARRTAETGSRLPISMQ